MKFTPAQLDNHAIALLADEIDSLPEGVIVEPSEFSNNTASLVRWAEPQHTTVINKQVFIGHYPEQPAPFDIGRTMVKELDTDQTPIRSHGLKSRFRQELAETIEWITTDDPRF